MRSRGLRVGYRFPFPSSSTQHNRAQLTDIHSRVAHLLSECVAPSVGFNNLTPNGLAVERLMECNGMNAKTYAGKTIPFPYLWYSKQSQIISVMGELVRLIHRSCADVSTASVLRSTSIQLLLCTNPCSSRF